MKLKYKIYDEADQSTQTVCFDFPMPFYENMNNYVYSYYGLFAKTLNHRSRQLRLVSAYDSGKFDLKITAPYTKMERKSIKSTNDELSESPVKSYSYKDLQEAGYSASDYEKLCKEKKKLFAIIALKKNNPKWNLRDIVKKVCSDMI